MLQIPHRHIGEYKMATFSFREFNNLAVVITVNIELLYFPFEGESRADH